MRVERHRGRGPIAADGSTTGVAAAAPAGRPAARPRSAGDEVLRLGVVADDGRGGLLGLVLPARSPRRTRGRCGRRRAGRGPWRCPRGRGTPGSPTSSGRPGTAGGTGRRASGRPRRRSPTRRGCGGASSSASASAISTPSPWRWRYSWYRSSANSLAVASDTAAPIVTMWKAA